MRWSWAVVAAAVLAASVACGGGSAGGGGGGSGGGATDGGGISTDGGGAGYTGTDGGGTGGTGTGGTGTGGTGTGGTGTDGGSGTGGTGTDGGSGTGGSGTGGTDGGTTSGGGSTPDAGTITFPNADGWAFYGKQNGGPNDVYDVAMDENGNTWVAGGTEGLFLLRPGSTTFQKFGLADGLHPYGYLNGATAKYFNVPDGSPADLHPDLAATPVISVAGGPGSSVFVGYQGKPGCEDSWNWQCDVKNPDGSCFQSNPPSQWGDPAVYKSGDADRVTLTGNGISVVHYDIFSGPDVVGAELGGREKICSVLRMVWDKAQDKIWFGGNHGFAVGKASYAGNPSCNGEYDGAKAHTDCAAAWEHTHPYISGCRVDTKIDPSTGKPLPCPSDQTSVLTDGYYGISLAGNGDVWFGGQNRSTVFHYGTYGGNAKGTNAYYLAEYDSEYGDDHDNYSLYVPGYCTAHNPRGAGVTCGPDNHLDLWPDAVPECTVKGNTCETNYVLPSQRNDDSVSGMAALGTEQAWVSSFAYGLRLVDRFGNTKADPTSKLLAKNVSALAMDPKDGSLWAGMSWGLGISRYDPKTNNVTDYSFATFGDKLANAPISNIQTYGAGAARKMLVGFRMNNGLEGAVGIYTGN